MPRCKVQKVIDGATIALEDGTKVRLASVEAPKLGRKGGAAAKRELEKLVLNKTITYLDEGRSYGRIVGTVRTGPKNINREMIKRLKDLSMGSFGFS